jgi:hypothetical protein
MELETVTIRQEMVEKCGLYILGAYLPYQNRV